MSCVAITTTVGSRDDARRLARALVERRLAACAQMVLLWIVMKRRLHDLGSGEILRSLAHTLTCATPAALISALLAHVLTPIGTNAWTRLVPGGAAACSFVAIFVGISWLTKSRELLAIRDAVARLRRLAG